jgi:glycerate-2-kinase
LLLHSGATIEEINTIRKHLSFVKGGQLVKQIKGAVISLIISDIVGDPLEFIASGPTYPDSTTFSDAKRVFEKYDLWTKIPKQVQDVLIKGINGKIDETPKKDNPVFENIEHCIVANNEIACKAAVTKATDMGYKALLLTTSLTGESRDMGRFLAEKAINYINKDGKTVFISGGETTVTIRGKGKGGRNQELALGAVDTITESQLVFSSFATDGIDGQSDAAGAIVDGHTLLRGMRKNLDINTFLTQNNSNEYFTRLHDVMITGPTGTNVMDIQLIVL